MMKNRIALYAFIICFYFEPKLSYGMLKSLKKNSVIEIVAPSCQAKEGELELAAEYIRSLGFVPKISENIYGDDVFYANTNAIRAKHLKEALLSHSDAIWAMRGGKGATELLPYLEGKILGFEGLPSALPKEKLLIGFSDFTAMHIFFNKFYNWQTLHAPMLSQIVENVVDETSKKALEDVISNNSLINIKYKISLIYGSKRNQDKNTANIIDGHIVGGNLTIVEKSIGTSWEIETSGKILFLEDKDEPAYKLERSLTHLIEAKKLDNVKAVLLGDFSNVQDGHNVQYVERRFVDKFSIFNNLNPKILVFKLNNVGHEKTNLPLPLNTKATIQKLDGVYELTVCCP